MNILQSLADQAKKKKDQLVADIQAAPQALAHTVAPAAANIAGRAAYDVTHNPVSNTIGRNVAQPAVHFMENGGLIGLNHPGYQQFSRGLSHGLERSAIGTGQALSGLYDLAGGQHGTNRVDKMLNTQAQGIDNIVKQQHVNPLLYKAAQAGGDALQFAMGGGEVKAGAKALTELPKVGGVFRAAGKGLALTEKPGQAIARMGQGGNIGQRVVGKAAGNILSPKYQAINAAFTAGQEGKNAGHGMPVTGRSAAMDLAMGGLAFPAAGAIGSEVLRPAASRALSGAQAGIKAAQGSYRSGSAKLAGNSGIDQEIAQRTKAIKSLQTRQAKTPIGSVASENHQRQIDAHQAAIDSLEGRRQKLSIPERLMNQQVGNTVGGPQALAYRQAKLDGKVFKGVDGKSRFEIDDSTARIHPEYDAQYHQQEGIHPLAAVLDHPKLYEQYPGLRDTPVIIDDSLPSGTKGQFDGQTLRLNPNEATTDDDIIRTILHETQHNIQDIEKFAPGGSPGTFSANEADRLSKVAYQAELKRINLEGKNNVIANIRRKQFENKRDVANKKYEAIRAKIDNNDPELMEQYRRLAGEAEARAVESRAAMSPEYRNHKPFYDSLDVPKNELITNHREGTAMSMKPVNGDVPSTKPAVTLPDAAILAPQMPASKLPQLGGEASQTQNTPVDRTKLTGRQLDTPTAKLQAPKTPARNADAERMAIETLQKGGTNDTAVYGYMKATGKGLQDAVRDVRRASEESGVTFKGGKNPLLGTVSVPKVSEGDFAQANHNSKFVQAHEQRLGKQATESYGSLNSKDQVLLKDIETAPIEQVAKGADNPAGFKKAAADIRTYYDTRHAYDHMLGINVGYRSNYLRQLFDRVEQQAPDASQISLKGGNKNPGYTKNRTKDTLGTDVGNALERDVNGSSFNHAKLTYEKGLNEAYPGKVANGELVRTSEDGNYRQLQHPFGTSLSVPKDVAQAINSRTWQQADSKALETYDKINHGLKYAKLSGGLFHAFTEAGNFIGQQAASGKLITNPVATGRMFKVFFSPKAMQAETERLHATGVMDKAHLSGLTLTPKEILADANVNLRAKSVDKVTKYTGLQAMHAATFQREIPYAKAKIFEQKTQGLDVNNPADLHKMRSIAREVNQIFGGIDRMTSGIKPGTFKWLQRGVLATDFTEAKWHTLSDALTSKGAAGNLARQTVAGKVVLFGLLASIGGAAGGEYNGKSPAQIAKNATGNLLDPSFTAGGYTAKFPKTHISEAIDAFKPYNQAKGAPYNLSGLQHYATSRLAALPSEASQLLANKDYYGQPIYGKNTKKNGGGPISPAKVGLNAVNTVAPIPFGQGVNTAQGKQNAAAMAANIGGMNVRPTPTPKTPTTSTAAPASDIIKAAFNSPEGKSFMALTDAEKKSAAQTDPKARGLYDQYQAMKTGLKQNTTLRPMGLDPAASKILDHYERLTPTAKAQVFDRRNGAEAEYNAAKYAQDKASGTLTRAQDIRAQAGLVKDRVGADFTKSTRDTYGLSKDEVYDLITRDPNGNQIAKDLLAYGDALQKATGTQNKFRTKKGAESFQTANRGGGTGGGRTKSLSALLAEFKLPGSQDINNRSKAASLARSAGLAKKRA